jgi:RimJ/RimL family protein N-acetyltransferase
MPERTVLQNGVVRLDPLSRDDCDGLLAAALEDRATYRFTHVPADIAGMQAYVENALDEEAAGRALPFVVRLAASGRSVGSTRYLDIEHWDRPDSGPPAGHPTTVEIGSTWLAASVQRSPVNTAAKLLLLTHAFEVWEVERVSFQTDARNERSRRAIERIGARPEGVRRAHKLGADGTIRDSAFFSILRAEWPATRQALEQRLREARPTSS